MKTAVEIGVMIDDLKNALGGGQLVGKDLPDTQRTMLRDLGINPDAPLSRHLVVGSIVALSWSLE